MDDRDSNSNDLPATIAKLGGMSDSFDRFLESVLAHLRSTLGVPPQVIDPGVDLELDAVRRRLQAFRPRFEAGCAAAVVAHVPAADLAAVAAALKDDAVQIYLRAVRDMRDALARAQRTLADEMKEIALYEEPQP